MRVRALSKPSEQQTRIFFFCRWDGEGGIVRLLVYSILMYFVFVCCCCCCFFNLFVQHVVLSFDFWWVTFWAYVKVMTWVMLSSSKKMCEHRLKGKVYIVVHGKHPDFEGYHRHYVNLILKPCGAVYEFEPLYLLICLLFIFIKIASPSSFWWLGLVPFE